MSPEGPRPLEVRAVGDAALSAVLGTTIDSETNARVRALDEALRERGFAGFQESVPAHASLLVCFDPALSSFEDASAAVREAEARTVVRETPGRRHEIAVRYGQEDGPDLAAVAQSAGATPAEVVAYHSGLEYTAFMLGFLPGFAYLGLLPEALETPRLATPRPRVPPGSVAVAGRLTAVYPAATPGGWSILGRAAVGLFDPRRDPPSLIAAGDRVRFHPVAELEEDHPSDRVDPVPAGAASICVEAGGLLTTVQAAPRRGYRRFGVAGGGPLDPAAHAVANRAAGNADGTAALECTIGGPVLRFLRPTVFAIAGADLGARLERADLGSWPVPAATRVLAREGNVLTFAGRVGGCRAYLAFAGGIEVPTRLGSRSTDLMGAFGGFRGRALADGDELVLGPPTAGRRPTEGPPPGSGQTDEVTVRVVRGPQDDRFTTEAMSLLLSESFSVRSSSDRVGLRLEGPRLGHNGSGEIVSDGMVPGAIQVPPDGQPIVMLGDGPTTGGYPKIATVISSDLGLLAQVVPGAGRVRFQASR